MTLLGIHHVQLAMPAGEEQRAVEFYEGLLGLPKVAKPAHLQARGGCWFESGPARVHLGVEEPFAPARKAHPALLVDDIGALREKLQRAGIEVTDDQPLPGYDRFYVSDPFATESKSWPPISPTDHESGRWALPTDRRIGR